MLCVFGSNIVVSVLCCNYEYCGIWNEFHYFQFMVCILLAMICVSNRFMYTAKLVTAELVTAVTMYMRDLVTAEQSKHCTQLPK